MITPAQMYWLTRLGYFRNTAWVIAFLAILIPLLGGMSARTLKEADVFFRLFKLTTLPLVMSLLMLIFLPTTKEMAAILIVPRIANSEKVQQVGNKLYDLAVEWMDELKPNKNNNNEGKR